MENGPESPIEVKSDNEDGGDGVSTEQLSSPYVITYWYGPGRAQEGV